MNILENTSRKKQLLILALILGLGNCLIWGTKVISGFPVGSLNSTGTTLATDDTVLTFSSKLEFKENHFSHGLKVNWNGKSNLMQETGIATHGLRGELDIALEEGTSFGPSIFEEVKLDDEISLWRSYMQGRGGRISLIPLAGEFNGRCFYLLYMKRVYCGSTEVH